MRVTEKMIFESSIAQTERSRESLSQAQNEVASGTRVEHPGDDPVAAALSVGHTVDKARFTAVGDSAQKAADELNAADTALDGITTVANRAQVMGDEEITEPDFLLQSNEQVQDLGLHAHVQSRYRLVGDQDVDRTGHASAGASVEGERRGDQRHGRDRRDEGLHRGHGF